MKYHNKWIGEFGFQAIQAKGQVSMAEIGDRYRPAAEGVSQSVHSDCM